jgi:NAD(P)-dependent dehydrogenase (short-subunit alcohol dehydrogenase family)
MRHKKIWFITGAGRGMGVDLAKAALAPRRFIAGADAVATAEQVVADLTAQIDANRELSTSLAFDLETAV